MRGALVRRWTLTLLALHPAHVYALRKQLIELGIPPVGSRDLYWYEEEVLVTSAWATAKHAGHDRRVYYLTDLGLGQLRTDRELLERTEETLTEFLAIYDETSVAGT